MSNKPTIFVDEHLLDDLLGQLGKKIRYDRVVEGGVDIGLSPKISLAQKPVLRDLSQREKIHRLLEHLRKEGALAEARPVCSTDQLDATGVKEYVLETCRATKVFIPTKSDPEPHFRGLNIWISLQRDDTDAEHCFAPGMLCLLENFYNGKTRFHVSGYTLLLSLIGETRAKLEKTVLVDAFPVTSAHDDKWPHSWQYRWNVVGAYMDAFTRDPIGTLQSLGCIASKEREIEVLYYIRDLGPDEADGRKSTSMFGYPIFIRAA